MGVKPRRRLPGIRFEATTNVRSQELPRMDVTSFVGFASSGPLHCPVLITHVEQFSEVFGADAPLAWDTSKGEVERAFLGPAVRAYFANGGKRCWVTRVADETQASASFFPLPGLLCCLENDEGRQWSPAFAPARSEGSWADDVEVAVTGRMLGLSLNAAFAESATSISVDALSPGSVQPGEVVRVLSSDATRLALGVVGEVNRTAEQYTIHFLRTFWWSRVGTPQKYDKCKPTLTVFSHDGQSRDIAVNQVPEWPPDGSTSGTEDTGEDLAGGADVDIIVDLAQGVTLQDGTVLNLRWPAACELCNGASFWCSLRQSKVESAGAQEQDVVKSLSSPSHASPVESTGAQEQDVVRLTCRGFFEHVPDSSIQTTSTGWQVDRLSIDVWARHRGQRPVRLEDVRLAPEHPRFWGHVPTDQTLFGSLISPVGEGSVTVPDSSTEMTSWTSTGDLNSSPEKQLWAEVLSPRFPLGASDGADVTLVPLLLPVTPQFFLAAESSGTLALERDGLASFNSRLFLDDALQDVGTDSLLASADYIRFQSPEPRSLRGIYTVMGLDEVSLVAIPDLAHSGWTKDSAESEQESDEPTVKRSGEFVVCQLPAPAALSCTYDVLTSSVLVTWTGLEAPVQLLYELEEARSAEFDEPMLVHTGQETECRLYGRATTDYFYRVRGVTEDLTGAWSSIQQVSISSDGGAVRYVQSAEYDLETVRTTHAALLRLCAARGDLFAVLTFPRDCSELELLSYRDSLSSRCSPPLERELSFGAAYHPWVVGGSPLGNVATPPDGHVCGTFAHRAIGRGVWIAPANHPLEGVLAVVAPPPRGRALDYLEAQVNLLWNLPGGPTISTADTLSTDPDVLPINVRRLLALLRRAAIRLGNTYVFEPNSDRFHRRVKRGFEEMLFDLYQRGAFAGPSPETSYSVTVAGPSSTSPNLDEGRLIVELKIAPSLPLSFLTVRLIQSGTHDGRLEVS